MLHFAKKAGLMFAALIAAFLIFVMATAPHARDIDPEPTPAATHPSHHPAAPAHHAADVALAVHVFQDQDGTQLALGSAGQTAPSSLTEISTVLGNYSAEGTTVDLFLEVDDAVTFSTLQGVIEPLARAPHTHLHLTEKYVLTPAKSHAAEATPD